MTAENKFARSISQLVTMKSEDSIGLCLASLHYTSIGIGNFSFVPQPLQLGDLKVSLIPSLTESVLKPCSLFMQGNHFNIALRKVIGNKGQIEASLRSLKDNGFINYYDDNHFGFIRDVPKHLIGKQLLLKQWQEVIQFLNYRQIVQIQHFLPFCQAIDLILQPSELKSTGDYLSNLTLACIEYKFSRDVHLTFDEDILKNSIKAQLLSNIKIHGENLVKAVNAVCIENIDANF